MIAKDLVFPGYRRQEQTVDVGVSNAKRQAASAGTALGLTPFARRTWFHVRNGGYLIVDQAAHHIVLCSQLQILFLTAHTELSRRGRNPSPTSIGLQFARFAVIGLRNGQDLLDQALLQMGLFDREED